MKSFRHSALTTLILGMTIAAVADEREERLSDEHRKWLKEEAVYIITEQEKDVFLSLETEKTYGFWRRDGFGQSRGGIGLRSVSPGSGQSDPIHARSPFRLHAGR